MSTPKCCDANNVNTSSCNLYYFKTGIKNIIDVFPRAKRKMNKIKKRILNKYSVLRTMGANLIPLSHVDPLQRVFKSAGRYGFYTAVSNYKHVFEQQV